MDAKTAVEILKSNIVDYAPQIMGCKPISIKRCEEIADYIEQQDKQIKAMRNCKNCHYQEYTELDLPCNNCIRCYEGNEEDCCQLRAELLKVEVNKNA